MRALSTFATLVALFAWIACSGGTSNSNSGGSNGVPTVSSIQVSPASMSIGMGAQQQFQAIAHLSDGTSQNVTSSAVWSSSDSNIASVSAAGVATASASGTVTITAQ